MNVEDIAIRVKHCIDCGLELKDKHLFCYNCGKKADIIVGDKFHLKFIQWMVR